MPFAAPYRILDLFEPEPLDELELLLLLDDDDEPDAEPEEAEDVLAVPADAFVAPLFP